MEIVIDTMKFLAVFLIMSGTTVAALTIFAMMDRKRGKKC